MEFSVPVTNSGELYPASYSLRLSSSRGEYRVEAEDATWYGPAEPDDEDDDNIENDLLEENIYVPRSFRRDADGAVEVDGQIREALVPTDILAISMFKFQSGAWMLLSSIEQMRFAHIYPNVLREPSRPDTDRRLKENCSNWASMIKAMRQRRITESRISKITEMMQHVLPGLQKVTVKGVGGYLVPQFLVKDSARAKAHYFDPIQLSDGTLRVFAMLLTIYQLPPARLLAIEEPEQTVHPGILGLLFEAFKEVSDKTQLVITTHSPHFLDYFSIDEIRVVKMIEGETVVSPIRRAQVEIVKQGLMTVSEIMALDGLDVES